MNSLPTDASQIVNAPVSESKTGDQPSHDAPFPIGDHNENPAGIGLLPLLLEDYRTYDRNLFEPGFWAVAIHRFGNARMAVKFKLLRAPLTVFYRLLYTAMIWLWGIDLPYNTKLGRRVRIWHHGGIWIGARSIGDDVHIRHNTTLGILSRKDLDGKPIIGDRVEIGLGASILGPVTVADDSVIGPNSIVIRDVPPGSVVMGVPARQTALWSTGAPENMPNQNSQTTGKEVNGSS